MKNLLKAEEVKLKTQAQTIRKIGFELEFAGIELEDAARIIKNVYGGTITKNHRYYYQVAGTAWGTFRVELDARILRRMASQGTLKKWGIDFKAGKGSQTVEGMVDRVAKTVVPIEIVMPPVPMDKAEELDVLRGALQQERAEGTGVSLVHAFGMHINIECVNTEVEMLLAYLRSFILLYPWLLKQLKIDVTRRLSPFVDAFPDAYTKHVLNPRYNPTKEKFIQDYISFNPTRNRPLDFMPIFAMNEPERVAEALQNEKNTPRPTFHYRLPNSNIDDPDWRLMDELNYWMVVEQLAQKPALIEKLSRLYLLQKQQSLVSFNREWAEMIAILLDLDA